MISRVAFLEIVFSHVLAARGGRADNKWTNSYNINDNHNAFEDRSGKILRRCHFEVPWRLEHTQPEWQF